MSHTHWLGELLVHLHIWRAAPHNAATTVHLQLIENCCVVLQSLYDSHSRCAVFSQQIAAQKQLLTSLLTMVAATAERKNDIGDAGSNDRG